MPVLEIIQPGLLTTVQDLGRKGARFFAIPTSGVMDPVSATRALLLLQQAPDSPLLECTYLPPAIRFHSPARIALTGADFRWSLNGMAVRLDEVVEVNAGDELRGKTATNGLRGYIAVGGKWLGEAVYGSHATYLNGRFGGHEGRALRKGDRLRWGDEMAGNEGANNLSGRGASGKEVTGNEIVENDPVGKGGAKKDIPAIDIPLIPLQKGPEFHWLHPQAQELLFQSPFTIAPDSNRMGARLQGPPLTARSHQLPNSVPVLPGFLQLPPSGQPIVVLQDGQVTGGYPRIAYIPRSHLPRFNQIPLGKALRFHPA